MECRFHLNTCIGAYIVSTVGEWMPDSAVREILANSRGISLEGRGDARLADWMKKVGWEEIGCGRKYETMVFRATIGKTKCCPFVQERGTELDSEGYNDADDATYGHLRMCEKWAKRKPKRTEAAAVSG